MGELTIRRNRGFAVPPYQGTAKTEKKAAAGQAQSVSRTTGFAVSETLRQLMSRVSQAENQSRESRRTLQTGEAVLDEVQDRLGRLAELAEKAAGGGASDRAALQAELEQLRGEIDRMTGAALAGDTPLFLDGELGVEDGGAALLDAIMGETSAAEENVRSLPDWLLKGIAQGDITPERLLAALGLDQTAAGPEILAAILGRPLDGNYTAGYLAALYLGAVIAGGSTDSIDPEQAMEGLRQLLEKVAEGLTPDEAIEQLTNGEFTSFEDFQNQFISGTAPGLQDFLVELLLGEGGSQLLTGPALLAYLAGLEGMNLDLLMSLLTNLQSGETSLEADAAGLAEQSGPDAAAGRASVLQLGSMQVMGADLSGVSFDAASGLLTIGGTADVTVQGTGQGGQAILLTGSGSVTLQQADVSTLTIASPDARIFSAGRTALGEVRLQTGAALTLGGGGLLSVGGFRGDGTNVLRLSGGAVVLTEKNSQTLAELGIPVLVEGPVSLAARASRVRDPGGRALTPMDVVWKTLLPGFSAVTSLTLDGKQTRLALSARELPDPIRLWLAKGDSSHGSPIHALTVRGRDEFGRPRTRYAYLLWNQREGSFQETAMYPNPFTVTGGEEGTDWVYEEESHTLRILSNQVTAIAGGAGTDANQTPFSGRIALADGIGDVTLTLGGVACRVSSGRAFCLGRENHVKLLLQSGSSNHFESGEGFAGISLGDGASLEIDCAKTGSTRDPAGVLTAAGGEGGAGIGRDSDAGRDRTSRILIRGGVITAVGAGGGAGIGAGKRSPMGPVPITGGAVTATGGKGGAGIGAALGARAGDISIRGGTIAAEAACHAAAIGAGVQGESGNILITGTARIIKALGGDPGADIGACLLGGCGKVDITGGADIGGAKLRPRSGVTLRMGEESVTLPQFRLSARTLCLDKISVSTRESARIAAMTIEADRRWVSRVQSAYGALYGRLEQNGLRSVYQYISITRVPVRDAASAGALLADMRQAIPLPASQAMQIHSGRGMEDVRQLLR